jgi:DNA-directed RNA polymerase alpha subunit
LHIKFSPVTLATYTYEETDIRSDAGPDKFHFKVETDGSYSAKQAVAIALKRISNKLQNFSNQLDFIS